MYDDDGGGGDDSAAHVHREGTDRRPVGCAIAAGGGRLPDSVFVSAGSRLCRERRRMDQRAVPRGRAGERAGGDGSGGRALADTSISGRSPHDAPNPPPANRNVFPLGGGGRSVGRSVERASVGPSVSSSDCSPVRRTYPPAAAKPPARPPARPSARPEQVASGRSTDSD